MNRYAIADRPTRPVVFTVRITGACATGVDHIQSIAGIVGGLLVLAFVGRHQSTPVATPERDRQPGQEQPA